MAPTPPKLIFGTANVATLSAEAANKMFSILEQHNVKDLDTAYIYTDSEATLKKYGVTQNSKFIIHTKAPGFKAGGLSKESILKGLPESLERLGVDKVTTYFLHAPDDSTPISETLSAISELHRSGKFTHFGLSNFTPAQVQEIYDLQKSSGSILPSVFQGNYNAFSRGIEKTLFPLLRKLNIAFYAYSPIAGGFLVKSVESLKAKNVESGRFSEAAKSQPVGLIYDTMYNRPTLLEGLEEWEGIAKAEGVSKAALAYRWVAWHSAIKGPGDGVIVGASRPEQLEESLKAIEEGPLSEESVRKIEGVWKKIEKEAPLDNYHDFAKEFMVKAAA